MVLVLAAAGTFLALPDEGILGALLGVVLSPVFLVVVAGLAGLCIRAAKGGLKG